MLAKIPSPLSIALLLLALPGAARCQVAPEFTIDTPQGKYAGVRLLELNAAGTLRIEESGDKKALPRFVELRQENRPLPPILTRNFALLTNGDRIPLDASAPAILRDSKLKVWPDASLPGLRDTPLTLFAPNVVLLFWSLPDGVDDAELFFIKLAEAPRARDVVYFKNGDRVEGSLVSLDAKVGCTLKTSDRTVTTPWAQIAGIAWNTERQARLRTRNAFTRAILEGGARLNFLDIRFEEKTRQWLGKTQFGATLELPEANVVALQTRQAHAIDLSELTPTRYEQRPYLGASWPLAKDAAADGKHLRVGGSAFEKGLGTHAPCRITYALDGKYRRFDALVGIDELSSRRGRAKIALELDGERIDLNAGKELTSQTPPVEIRLDVQGKRTLTLIVELGAFGDVQANVNWANARLIKRE